MARAISDNARPMLRHLSPSRCAGFTLLELMMTLAIAAMLMMLAAPSVRDAVMNTRISTQANDLMTDFAATRMEAVRRAVWTGMCPSADGVTCIRNAVWNVGWIAFVDEDQDGNPDLGVPVLRRAPAFDNPNQLTLAGGPPFIVQFRTSGTLPPVAARGMVFQLCDSRKGADATNHGRLITISNTGRATSEVFTCP
jgi:type IV fimbrial biogenesis protein FimT